MTSNKIEAILDQLGCIECRSYPVSEDLVPVIKSLNNTYLELVLEIIGDIEQRETEDMSLLSWTPEDYKVFGKNELKIELRNALNQRLGEDKTK